MRTLLALYEREGGLPEAIGLGAWQVDLPMLRAVHRPIVLPGSRGPGRAVARGRGPACRARPVRGARGWNDAVLAALTGRRLPSLCPGASEPRADRASGAVPSRHVAARA